MAGDNIRIGVYGATDGILLFSGEEAMTDDTLREECETLLAWIEDQPRNCDADLIDKECVVTKLTAFARTQHAKGIKEALRMVDEQRAEDSRRWALFRSEVKAQATAREAMTTPDRPAGESSPT